MHRGDMPVCIYSFLYIYYNKMYSVVQRTPPIAYEERIPNNLSNEYKIKPTPANIIINLITQGNLGGEKAIMPTVRKSRPKTKLNKTSK